MKKLCVVLSVTRRDILLLLKGQDKPTVEQPTALATYTKANEDLYAILYLLVGMPAALSVQKHEDESEISGNGQAAFEELRSNYDKVTDQVLRATMEELVNTTMEPMQNPDDYFNKKHLLRHRAEKMGETVSDRWFKDICVTGFSDDYKDVKMMMYRDSTFDIDQMQSTMRNIFIDEQSRSGTKGRIAGRGVAMTTTTSSSAEIVYHLCKEPGHIKNKKVKESKRNSGGGSGKWCSFHRSSTHSNDECYMQGAERPAKALSACTKCTHCNHSSTKERSSTQAAQPSTKDSSTQEGIFDFTKDNEDFDGGFMFNAFGDVRRFAPNADGATLLIDTGASETFLDDELIPGLKDRMKEYKDLNMPKVILVAGGTEIH